MAADLGGRDPAAVAGHDAEGEQVFLRGAREIGGIVAASHGRASPSTTVAGQSVSRGRSHAGSGIRSVAAPTNATA